MNVSNPVANALNGGGSTLRISGLTATDGYVLTVQADGTLATEASAASGVGGSTGSTDNALLRADGTGGATVQSSGITVADAASGVAEMTAARLVRGIRPISSSPDTQQASDDVLEFSAALTVDLLTSVTTGREFLYVCTAAATLTLDPGGTDTIDGGSAGAALAIPCAAGQAVRLIRSGSGAWRSVQPRSVIGRITATVIGGAFVAYGESWIDGAWAQVTQNVAPTVTGDPDGLGATGSGATITWAAGAGTAVISTNVATEAQYVGWAFADIAAGLGLDQPRPIGIRTEITSAVVTSGGASDYANLFGALGTSGALATNMQYAVGIRCPNTGNAAIRAVAAVTGLGSTGSATSTIRRVGYFGPTPMYVAQLGSVYSTDVSDVFENVLNVGTSVGIAGTPTHFFVLIGASTTQRATVINGPFVRFYV